MKGDPYLHSVFNSASSRIVVCMHMGVRMCGWVCLLALLGVNQQLQLMGVCETIVKIKL